jgi:hypothetical protein
MKHSARYTAVANMLRAFPRKGLSIVAVISIGWLLRKLFRWDGSDEGYVIRAYKGHYVDPTNLYKFYGSYGKS